MHDACPAQQYEAPYLRARTCSSAITGGCTAAWLFLFLSRRDSIPSSSPSAPLRIQANPAEPHGAVADFVLVRTRQEQEVSREQWTATMQFVFMPVIPADLVIFNPMGIQITYLETDRTLITETP